jgi:hypothetical protein
VLLAPGGLMGGLEIGQRRLGQRLARQLNRKGWRWPQL